MPRPVLPRVAPADQLVPAAQIAGDRLERQTARDPLPTVPDEVLHLAAEGVLAAQVVYDGRPTRSTPSPPRGR